MHRFSRHDEKDAPSNWLPSLSVCRRSRRRNVCTKSVSWPFLGTKLAPSCDTVKRSQSSVRWNARAHCQGPRSSSPHHLQPACHPNRPCVFCEQHCPRRHGQRHARFHPAVLCSTTTATTHPRRRRKQHGGE